MKKYIIFLSLIMSAHISMGQIIRSNPTTGFQQFGTSVTLSKFNGVMYPAVGYIPALYADTFAMNATYLKNVPLAQAGTIDGKYWMRNFLTTAWVELGSGGLSYTFPRSVVAPGNAIQLENDTTASPANYFYGRNSVGRRGWYAQSSIVGATQTLQQTITAGSELTMNDTIFLNATKLMFKGATPYPSRHDTLNLNEVFLYSTAVGGSELELYGNSTAYGYGKYSNKVTSGGITMRHFGDYTAGCTTCGLNSMGIGAIQNASYPGGVDTVIGGLTWHNGPNDKHFNLMDQTDAYAGPGIPADRLLTVEKYGAAYASFYNNPANNNAQVLIGFYPAWLISNYETYRMIVGGKFAVNDTAHFLGKVGIGTATPDSSLTVTAGIWGKRGVRFSGLPSSHNAADSMMVVNVSDGSVGYRNRIPSLTATQIGYGSGGNTLTSSGDFTYSSASRGVLNLSNGDGTIFKIDADNEEYQMGSVSETNGTIFKVEPSIAYFDNTAHNIAVGINTASPTVALDVQGGAGIVKITSSDADVESKLVLNSNGVNIITISGDGANSQGYVSTLTDYDLSLTSSGTGRTYVNSSTAISFIGAPVDISNLSGTGTRTVLADASGVVSAPVSDRSTKQNITDLNTGISTIMKLRPVSFEYRDEYKKQFGKGTQIGFIAQDIQEVLPNSVYYNTAGVTKGKMGYNEIDLVPLLVSAMQEQQKQIEQLQKEIKKLKRK